MVLAPGIFILCFFVVVLPSAESHFPLKYLRALGLDNLLKGGEDCFDPTLHPNWSLFDLQQCGRRRDDRIIGGTMAGLGAFPWIARLGHSGDYYIDLFCGGVLINNRYVLTAAHCVSNLYNPMNVVRLGDHTSGNDVDCYDGECAAKVQDFTPELISIHPKFRSDSYNYDVALVRLNAPVKFSDWVMPICMVHGSMMKSTLEKQWVEVAGWGIYDININQPSEVLEVVRLKVVKLGVCKQLYEDIAPINDKQICAGGTVGKDSCGGDSGGPLMMVSAMDGEPKYYVIGVVSFGDKKCGSSDLPGVYTRIASYMKWILGNMRP